MAASSIFSNTARCIPICPLFCLQKKVFSNQNKGHLGSRYIYSTKSIQTWNLWKFKPLWESRLFFVSLFRWVKSAWKLSTYPWGWKTSNWVCVFGPIHDNKPSKRRSKSREFPWLIPESLRAGTEWTSHMQDEEQNLSHHFVFHKTSPDISGWDFTVLLKKRS